MEERAAGGVKREPIDEEDDGAPPEFWTTALGLRPVGAAAPPRPSPPHQLQKLNARGMPARIRKKNKLFFDDNIVNAPPPRASPKRGPRTTPAKTPSKLSATTPKKTPKSPTKTIRSSEKRDEPEKRSTLIERTSSPDRKTSQRIGTRLRNLLKLPKAHKWVCFEYFYSNIDRALFIGENDFNICLRDLFPKLKDRCFTKIQWVKMRRAMGKPRRCSQAFFDEERKDLDLKRQRIRFIQQRKTSNVSWKELPNEIPMQLVIGTKVTARLRKPQDGIFTGVIEGVDTSNNTYRITFERNGLGTHSVPDYEVLSNEPPDTLNISAVTQKFKSKQSVQGLMNLYQNTGFSVPSVEHTNDPIVGGGLNAAKYEDSMIGGYHVRFLESLVRITKILHAKRDRIAMMKDLNSEVERRRSFNEELPEDFERKYASIIIELERMNLTLFNYLTEVRQYCHELAPGLSIAAMLTPSHVIEKSYKEAINIVNRNNSKVSITEDSVSLITDLIALLLHVKSLSDSQQNAFELQALRGKIQHIKDKLSMEDQATYQNCVEIHMQKIMTWLGSPPLINPSNDTLLDFM